MPESLQIQYQDAILCTAETLLDEAVSFLQGLIGIPTVNPPGNAYPECAHYIGEHLRALDY